MKAITLTDAQIHAVARQLRGVSSVHPKRLPNLLAEAMLAEAGVLPETLLRAMTPTEIDAASLSRLEEVLDRCDGCETYQLAGELEPLGEFAFCNDCIANLTYRQSLGG